MAVIFWFLVTPVLRLCVDYVYHLLIYLIDDWFWIKYKFEGPQKLLTDFFNEVNTVLEQENDQKNP